MTIYLYPCNGFDSTILPDSKILIVGTLPPYDRHWYYEEDKLFWEILKAATNDYCEESRESKEHFLKRNKIALWDVLAYGERTNDKSSDSIFEKPDNKNLPENEQNPKPNKIWENLQNIEIIITNGKSNAFKWLKKYNKGYFKELNRDDCFIWNNKIMVYRFYSTSYINNPRKQINKEKEKKKWIETIRKHSSNKKTLTDNRKIIVLKKNKRD